MYPALELRLYLSASLKAASSLPMSIHIVHTKAITSCRRTSVFDDAWTPRPRNKDNNDREEDIFDFSGTNSSADNTPDKDVDEESLYCDAMSRKESTVSNNFECECDFV